MAEKLEELTREELRRIQKSMKRPEFMGLLNEYMVEISDPKNKDEYDEYLKQMQRENELPKEMSLIQLSVGFCVRTKIISQTNKRHEMKFFINMCASEVMERAKCEPAERGHSWQIPHTVGKVRYDQDRHHNPCQVCDVAFHPDVLLLCRHPPFQEMVVGIALDASERQLGERKETLSRDYIILKNLKCKGEKPALLPVRLVEGKICNKGDQRDLEGRETKLQKDLKTQKEEYNKSKLEKQEEEELKEEPIEEVQSTPYHHQEEKGVERPKYSTILTYSVDYSEFIGENKSMPTHLNVEFKVPRVEASDIAGQKLQINDRQLILEIGNKYFIDLSFEELKVKHRLQVGDAKAKYDKKKKCLRVIIPIIKETRQEERRQEHPVQHNQHIEKSTSPKEENFQTVVHQDQTWKHKVLQFSESSVTTGVLNEIQEALPPPLIEEIDEDDFEEKILTDEENKEKDLLFSLQNYTKVVGKTYTVIPFRIYEDLSKAIMTWRTKGSKREDIKWAQLANYEWAIQWNQQGLSRIKVKEEFKAEIAKAQIIVRIGFVALILTKVNSKIWEGDFALEGLFDPLTKDNVQTIQNLIKEASIKNDKAPQVRVQESTEIMEEKQPSNSQLYDQSPQQTSKAMQETNDSVARDVKRSMNQPQFIEFNVALVQQLD